MQNQMNTVYAENKNPMTLALPPAVNGKEKKPVERTENQKTQAEEIAVLSTETPYHCHHLMGGLAHPGLIVETGGLSNIKPPRPVYRPLLPLEMIETGKFSLFQLERIVYAGKSHETRMTAGNARCGFSIGDGTGTGKTTTLLGIVLDNWFRGRKRTVWFSVKQDLVKAVKDEMTRLGIQLPIKLINDYKPDEDVTLRNGIIFCTYQSLIAKSKKGARRLDQLTKWLGEDGVLVFDEGHRAKNYFSDDHKNQTQTGAAVVEIQDPKKFPGFRVVYSSATAATDVRHLAYMTRLDLWGAGTAFPTFTDFAVEIEEGGHGAMEMVCRDLKAMGRYFCGSLSMGVDPNSGLPVEYREAVHNLTEHQREMYDNMAKGWQAVLGSTDKALKLTNSQKAVRRFVMNNFWAEHQRCVKAVLTAFKVPTLIQEIERALSEQHSVVVSITSTGEAAMTRQMARTPDEEEAISELDFSPRETLERLVENGFPTVIYQEVTDPITEKIKFVPLLDETGNEVHSQAALALKRELLDRLATLQLPQHPLDLINNYFGCENVAEMTGRKNRLVKLTGGEFAYRPRGIAGIPQRQTNLNELAAFQNKNKRILAMSEVASTGESMHSDRRARNQERREHYALELKWSADKQLQDFGRTHRSNQVSPPIYILLYTNVGAEVRFAMSISRRLANTGALNKGDRRANQIGGLDRFNVESKEGRAALRWVYERILTGQPIPELDEPVRALRDMGILTKTTEGAETVLEAEKQNVVRFFNRVLSLEVHRQKALVDYYFKIYNEMVEHLKASGKYDNGLEDIKAKSVKIKNEPVLIYRDARTGAETHLFELETIVPTAPARFEDLEKNEDIYFYRVLGGDAEENYIAARPAMIHTDPETGDSYKTYAVSRPAGKDAFYITEESLMNRYRLVPKNKARDWWLEQVENIPPEELKTVYLLSGALLPVWRQIKEVKESNFKIVRTTTDDGERLVGLQIPKAKIKQIMQLFDSSWKTEDTLTEIYERILHGSESVELIENIRLRSAKVFGERYVEITPGRGSHPKMFRAFGITSMTVNGRERFFLPNKASNALALLTKLFSHFPPASGNFKIANFARPDGTKTSEKTNSATSEEHPAQHEQTSAKEPEELIDVLDWFINPPEPEIQKIKTTDFFAS